MLSFLLKPFQFLFYSKKNDEVTEIRDRDIEEIEKEYVIHPYSLDKLNMDTIHKLIEDVKPEPIPDNVPESEQVPILDNVPESEPEPNFTKYTNVKKNGISCGKNKKKKNSDKRKRAKEKQKKKMRDRLEKRKQKKHKYNLRKRK